MSDKLDDDIKFTLDLIAAEERQEFEAIDNDTTLDTQEQNKPQTFNELPKEPETGLILIERRDITIQNQFTLSGTDVNGNSVNMPISGKGVLDTFVVKSNNSNFEVRIEIDEFDVINDDFTTLQSLTTELSHVGAFTSNGDSIVSASDYPFNERINIIITPLPETEITLSVARAELIMGAVSDVENGLDPETAELLEGL